MKSRKQYVLTLHTYTRNNEPIATSSTVNKLKKKAKTLFPQHVGEWSKHDQYYQLSLEDIRLRIYRVNQI